MSAPTPTFAVSPTTKKVLDNFSKIAEQVILVEGTQQKVKGPGKGGAVLAVANLPEAWPKEIGIFNFDRFLGTLSLFEKPAIQFNATDSVLITNDSKTAPWQIKFKLSDTSTIERAPSKNFPVDNPAVEINLSKYTLEKLESAAGQLGLDRFTIAVSKDVVNITSANAKNPNSHVFQFTIPETEVKRHIAGFERSMRFQMGHFNLFMKGDYSVLIGEKWPYAYLQNTSAPVSYYVTEDK
jgi:hypothetical protein